MLIRHMTRRKAIAVEVNDMDRQKMGTEMMRLLSTTAMLASGVGLGIGALFVAIAALLQ